MASSSAAGPWEISFCDCSEGQKRHVHCQCLDCEGKIVSRPTAFRHRSRARHETAIRRQRFYAQSDSHSAVADPPDPIQPNLNCSSDNCETDDRGRDENPNSLEEDCILEIRHEYDNDDSNQLPSTNDDVETAHEEEDECEDILESDIKNKIVSCILDALNLQLELKISIAGFEQLLEWGRKIFCMDCSQFEHLWPKCWKEAESLLRAVGYRDAKKYMICLDESHRCHYAIMSSENDLCPHCNKKGIIPFYYLGLGPKVNLWVKDPSMCKKMLGHWFEKDHWIEEEHKEDWGYPLKYELWDGKRFAELQWFWDPNKEWLLPVQCNFCKFVISAQAIEASPGNAIGEKTIQCPSCYTQFNHKPCKTHGDPRNIAYVVHWDGFQPFDGKYNHGSGALEVQIATMSKKNRNENSEIYVIGFVPVYLLPNRRPISLDPFLSLLIDEIEDGFINGIEVEDYAFAIPDLQLPSGPTRLRHLILLVTADHPAICEICKAIFCGKNPCRRCKCGSTLIPSTNHYYYGDFRKSTKYAWQKRTIMDEIDNLQAIEEEERRTVAEAMAKEAGFTGLSILHRLNSLYSFDYRRDCVFDSMHMMALGVVKNYLLHILDIVDRNQVQERLSAVPWTAEFMSSRYPTQLSRIGYWKAEDFQKFAFPIAEYVLGDLLPDDYFEGLQALSRLVEFMYCQGRNGWTVDSAAVFNGIVIRFNVLNEETLGLKACHMVNHNLTHVHEDVMNFGAPDNYWCYNFERAVGRYVSISCNNKNLELTFARAELRREVLKARQASEMQSLDCGYSLESHYSSLAALNDVVKNFDQVDINVARNDGILLGSLKGVHLQDPFMRNSICEQLFQANNNCLSDVAQECRSIYFPSECEAGKMEGILYRVGETVICRSPTCTLGNAEQVILITQLLRVNVNQRYFLFVIGDLFNYVTNNNEQVLYPRNKGYMPVVESSNHSVTLLTSCLRRKVMLVPDPDNISDPNWFVIIDYMRKVFPITSVCVPCYPEVGDMILVKGDDPEPWRALVVAVNIRNKTLNIQFYKPHPRWGRASGLWVREQSRIQVASLRSVMGISAGTWRGQGYALYKEL